MKQRFEGDTGYPLLVEALQKQDIVQQDQSMATDLAMIGELVVFPPNADVVVQNDADNSVYFLLTGEANVFVNDRFVGARVEGTCLGEMAAIDAAAPRSATIRAKTEIVALKVTEPKFRAALDRNPKAYRALAQLLARRLRQRSQFYQPPNAEPVLFIGCSTEALPIANELQAGFKHDRMDAIVWTNGVFGPSGTAVESLYQLANTADFAAFVISPDDEVITRKAEVVAPRDNVIFELGLFMGRLDPKRVFLIKEHNTDVKIPSDLLGITPVTYCDQISWKPNCGTRAGVYGDPEGHHDPRSPIETQAVMALKEDLQSEVKEIFATNFSTRKGNVVPEAEDIRLGNDAVTFEEAAVLYADLAGSTKLVNGFQDWFAAEVYKSYLHCASKIIRDQGGTVTAFDGDRVMAVFIGDNKRTSAAKSALKINHAVAEIINPAIKSKFPDVNYSVSHGVGIDMSKLFVARTGVRGSNDLVWVGRAANYAAKLCSIREENYTSFITAAVYDQMNEETKVGGDPKRSMWEKRSWTSVGIDIYRSNWRWSP